MSNHSSSTSLPRAHHKLMFPTCHLIHGCFFGIQDKLVTPTLFIHGRHDIFCDFEGSELFVNNNPDRHRLLEVDEKFGHDIVNSLESLPIAKQVGAWFGQHS